MSRTALVLGVAFGAMAVPAAAGDAAAPALQRPALRAEATARCIARRLPEGGQFFAADDGSFRVVSVGPRGKTAEWTVRPGHAAPVVSRQGGTAGIERGLRGTCY